MAKKKKKLEPEPTPGAETPSEEPSEAPKPQDGAGNTATEKLLAEAGLPSKLAQGWDGEWVQYQGWPINFRKDENRHFFQRKIAGKSVQHMPPQEFEPLMLVLKQRYDEKKERESSGNLLKQAEELWGEKKDEKKPLKLKTLEKVTWFNDLILDLGHYTLMRLASLVKLDPSSIKGKDAADKAYGNYIALLDILAGLKENPDLMMDLQSENNALKTQIAISQEGWLLQSALKDAAIERGNILLKHMDRDSLEAAAKEFMARGLMEFAPETIERIKKGEVA